MREGKACGEGAGASGDEAAAVREPDVIPYSAAVSAREKVLELLERMQRRRVEPDAISYNAAISACDNSEHAQKALELVGEMQ